MIADIPKEAITLSVGSVMTVCAWFVKKTLGRISDLEKKVHSVEIQQEGISTTLTFILKINERIETEVLKLHDSLSSKVDKD